MPYAEEFESALERQVEAAMGLTDEERRDMQLVTFVRGANIPWSFDEPSQAKHDALIKSLERHASARKGSTADQAGGNQPDGKTTGNAGPEGLEPTGDNAK